MVMYTAMDAMRFALAAMWSDKKKERFEMILEPLQATVQLALLSYCPIGSKLSISDNILYIQLPGWNQSVRRSLNADKKNDLVFLFNVIVRFHRFYGCFRNNDDPRLAELFETLLTRGKVGLENLIQTYNTTDCAHLTQTLKLYIQLLGNPDALASGEKEHMTETDIEDVFSQVAELHTTNHLYLIMYLFRLISKNPEQYLDYIDAIDKAMAPVNKSIRKWISTNIIF